MPPATATLIDTHCHLDQDDFDEDRSAVLDRARSAGVVAFVAVGITAASSEATLKLAAAYDGVHAAVGIHPNNCSQAADGDWDRVVDFALTRGAVAIGETGLDRYRDDAPLDMQQDYFDRHLRLSQRTRLPFVVHCRESQSEILEMLREARRRGPLAGVMHSFTGDADTARECLSLGLYISFAGMVTFKKSETLRQLAEQIPPDKILVETDSPFLSPHPLRGKRNEPANVVHTARCLAEARGEPFEAFANSATQNACRLFGISVDG